MLTLASTGTITDVTDSDQGNDIRTRRERLGLSQEALADKAGVSPGTVRRVEKGLPATKGALIVAALEREETRTERATSPPEPDAHNLRAVAVQLPRDQSIVSVERVRNLSTEEMSVFTVVAAGDATDDDVLRELLEQLRRKVDTDG